MNGSVPSRAPLPRWLRISLWVLLLGAAYPLSVLAVVTLYWLKTDHNYNMLAKGGWHAFSKCLIEQIPVTTPEVRDTL